jgi:hypothetical protein
MPYSRLSGGMERARAIGHVPLVESEVVQERLRGWRTLAAETGAAIDPQLIVEADALCTPGDDRRWVLAFDGSMQEVAAREAYPSTRIGYLQIAGVLVRLDELLGQGTERLVNPALIRDATEEALLPIVLPGSNVCRPDMPTVRDSWRAEVFDIFRTYTVEQMTLLHVFLLLVGYSDKHATGGGVLLARCSASEACSARGIVVPSTGTPCPSCGQRLFPTDSLRIHEEVSEEHGNDTALGRLMTVLEQVTMVAYLSFFLQRQPRVLGSVGFILDGPLAVFGPQAWLHGAIQGFIQDLYDDLTHQHLKPPVIVGIEKTGQFAEHAAAIGDRIPRRCLMALPDDYIYSHILAFRTTVGAPFGRDTYYGQKFLYKSGGGQVLVISVPKTATSGDAHKPEHYPTLPDTLRLLDRIGTTLYRDAVIPIALAHSFASIPLRTGTRVLQLLSREMLKTY